MHSASIFPISYKYELTIPYIAVILIVYALIVIKQVVGLALGYHDIQSLQRVKAIQDAILMAILSILIEARAFYAFRRGCFHRQVVPIVTLPAPNGTAIHILATFTIHIHFFALAVHTLSIVVLVVQLLIADVAQLFFI